MTIQDCEELNFSDVRYLNNHGYCGLHRYMFTIGLVLNIDPFGYESRYCYQYLIDAKKALAEWDGIADPSGPWIKHKGRGEDRTNPNFESEL